MSALPEDYGQGGSPPRQPRFPSSTAGPDHSSDQRGPPSDHSTASGTTETGHNGDQNGSSPSHPSEAGGPDSTHDGITHAPESNTEHNNYPVQLNGHPNGDINGILTENAEPNSEESTLPIQPIAQSNGVIHDAGGEGTEADIKDLTSAPPETPHQNSPISVVHGNSPNGVAGPPGPSPYNSPATSSPRDREDQEDSPVDDQDDDQEDEQDDDQVHNRVNGHQNHRGNGRGNGRGSGHGHGRGGSHGNGQGNGRGCSYGNGQGNGQGNGTPGSSIGSNGPTNVVAQGSVVDKSGTHDSSVPSTNVDLGSRANSGEQSIDSENFVSGDERHDGRGQNTTVSERNQALIDSDQSNLHTSHDREAHGGVLIFDGPGVSSSRNRGNASHSQYHSPGRHPTRFTLPSRAGPSSQDPAVFHPPPPVSQSLRPSSMNPIAPNFMPRPQQTGNISPGFTVPRWQPDSEAINCSICDARFGMFIRKHHCRKCGRVVCHSCSPHRITIPYAFIVRPPGVEGGGNATPLGPMGGERVRLCNPCVPDPNTTPPPRHPQNPQHSQPLVVDGRSSVARPLNDSGPSAESYRRHLSASSQVSNVYRSRSASTATGYGQAYHPSVPASDHSSQRQISQTSRGYSRYTPVTSRFGTGRASSPSSSFPGLNRPLPLAPPPEVEIREDDICPVCHLELPRRTLPDWEAQREIHIESCITSHISAGANPTTTATGGHRAILSRQTLWRTRMSPYVATEKDCVDDAECIICLEEFKAGDHMARLECFCRFHRKCIDSWFVGHPGRCPVHQHDSFGY